MDPPRAHVRRRPRLGPIPSRLRLSALLSGLAVALVTPAAVAQDAPLRLGLDELLRRVEETNPAMDIARATLADYQAQFDRAYYAWTPSLRIESILAPLPERRPLRECVIGSYIDPATGNSLPEIGACPGQDLEADERITADTEIGILTRTTARLTFPIYTFGRVEHGLEAARAGLDIGRAGLDVARGELHFLVKQAYYGAQLTASALDIIEDGRDRMQKAKREIEAELEKESGRFTSNDLRKLIVEEADLEASYLETDALREVAWAALRLAAAVGPSVTFELDTLELEPVHVEQRSAEAYVELAAETRPEVRMARAAVEARMGQVEMAEAEFLPNIALVGAFGYARGTTAYDPPDPFANDNYNFLSWGVVLGLDWRIDFADLQSKLGRAQAQLQKQRAQYEALTQKLRLEVLEQVGLMRRRAKELDARRLAMKAAKGWLVSNTLNFGLGLTTTDALLQSLIAYSKARLTYFRTIYDHNLAVARLSQTVGIELAVPAPEGEGE